jgi:aryl-alcohol dehydrogenase-like predicted oxidoreductase
MDTLHKTKIGLGTAQFGLNYGVSNSGEQAPEDEVRKILRFAWDSGVRVLDTAAAYGTSEEILGKNMEPDCPFNIVTNIPKIGIKYSKDEVGTFIRQTFETSLKKLRRESIYSLMFHEAADLYSETAQESYHTLAELKEKGFVKKIGVSVYI